MAWSTPDLADITNVLKGLLQTALNAPIRRPATSRSPATARDSRARTSDGYCHLTLYLLHVGRDPYWRNTPVSGPRPQLNNAQPLSLNLSYLLTAWHDTDFASEQRAMSIALQAIHSQPDRHATALIQHDSLVAVAAEGEFTVSIEADTIEEMSRLWQAITVPIRLSALIRAGVVFIAPTMPPSLPSLPPTVANLSVEPEPMATGQPLLFAGGGVVMPPTLPTTDPAQVAATTGPLTAVGGSSVVVAGNELALPGAVQVFLSAPGAASAWDITPWRQAPMQPGQISLLLPAGYTDAAATPPVATPVPGLYSLSVGSVPLATRSNAIPIAIAPRVDGVTDVAGLYTVAGAGFDAATTILAVGQLALMKTLTPTPLAGQFTVNPAGTAISFMLPTPAPAKGTYPLLIQVNGIAAAPQSMSA